MTHTSELIVELLVNHFEKEDQGSYDLSPIVFENGWTVHGVFRNEDKTWSVSYSTPHLFGAMDDIEIQYLCEEELFLLANAFIPIATPVFAEGIPIYGEDVKGLPMGMYLGLFHGFVSELDRQRKQDWGSCGPIIGPLSYAQNTYRGHLKYQFAIGYEDRAKLYGLEPEGMLDITEGVLQYQGFGYGDWTCHPVNLPEKTNNQ
ncbi:hypothetical protein GCM10028806_33790 [Spirosoma terrae]|uniref:Uncharacterized protein n=1 Tax=Spirosoma terrae TaxID=1968276 RepID=A0A6L9L982_9BACT|nr:hypothetical protein [Spirosoma terrae]NDU95691.1 hypothetical protein [Spirosoma terrae]